MAVVRKTKYRLPELPELREGGNAFLYEGRIGYSGSIIRRRQGTFNPFWHFGLIYGYDKRKTLWVIEINSYGVNAVRFLEFTGMGKYYYEIIDLVESPKASFQIIEKAKEFSIKYPKFDGIKNNCEMLVNYAHGKNKLAWQVNLSKWFTNVLLTATEINILQNKLAGKDTRYLMKQVDHIRTQIDLKRPQGLDKYLNPENQKS